MKRYRSSNQAILPIQLHSQYEWPEGYFKNLESLPMDAKIYGLDIETNQLSPYDDNAEIFSFSLSPKEGQSYASLVSHRGNSGNWKDVHILAKILGDPTKIIGGHNVKFDINWLRIKLGVEVNCMILDSLHMAYLINENNEKNSLEYLSRDFRGLEGYKEGINRGALNQMDTDDMLLYNAKDADASRRLTDLCLIHLQKEGLIPLANLASQVLPILSNMETTGVYVDQEWARNTRDELYKECIQHRVRMNTLSDVNVKPESSKELAKVLYGTMGFQAWKFTDAGAPSTDFETLKFLYDQASGYKQERFLDELIAYRKKIKLLTTYFKNLERWTDYDGRIHTTYWLGKTSESEYGSGGTATGRLSSSDPNLQNIPRDPRVKGMFAATPGYYWLGGDFGQLEIRVVAVLAQEKAMLDAFNAGLDIHTAVMADLKGMPYDELVDMLNDKTHANYHHLKNERVVIKRINFGTLYGVSAKRLQRLLKVEMGMNWELSACSTMISKWLQKYASVAKWRTRQEQLAQTYGYVTMPMGQKRRLPMIRRGSEAEIDHAKKQAVNFPVQSFASWITLTGMILMNNYFKNLDARIILQVHDSVESEVAITEDVETIRKDVQKIMEVDTIQYIKDVFNVYFNAPLSFDTTVTERWS